MILAIIGVIIGFVLLVKGADFFVEGSGSVAKKFNVPVFIIGMTIVAMGTSAPEWCGSVFPHPYMEVMEWPSVTSSGQIFLTCW